MKIKQYITLTLILFILLFTGCEAKTQHHTTQVEKKQDPYVDFKRWSEGRVCSSVTFMCLPESQDKSWQEQNLSDGLDTFELTKEVNKKYDRLMKEWNDTYEAYWETHDYEAYWKTHKEGDEPVKMSSLSKGFFERVEAKRFLVEMEQRLEKEFPGFWRDVPKPVRYRWIRRAMNKAKKFGSDPKQNNAIVELCARIGLDFDKDQKWSAIVKFITSDPNNIGSNILSVCDYLDWTLFGRTESAFGYKITDWAMRDTFGYLPAPKKPYPKLND